jgi:hypothetical protein
MPSAAPTIPTPLDVERSLQIEALLLVLHGDLAGIDELLPNVSLEDDLGVGDRHTLFDAVIPSGGEDAPRASLFFSRCDLLSARILRALARSGPALEAEADRLEAVAAGHLRAFAVAQWGA